MPTSVWKEDTRPWTSVTPLPTLPFNNSASVPALVLFPYRPAPLSLPAPAGRTPGPTQG